MIFTPRSASAGCCAVRLPSSQPPVCTGNQPFGLAFRSASDFHRLPTFRRCLPTQPPTDIGCQIQWPAFRSISNLRWRPTLRPSLPVNPRLAPPTDPPAPPFDRPATCAACRSSGHAFRPASSFRLRRTFRLDLPANLQLSPSINPPALPSKPTSDSHRLLHPPALPSDQPPAFAFDQSSSAAFEPNLRLSSAVASSGDAFRSISSFRLRSIFQPSLQT